MDFFQQFGIDVPPIGVALEDPERLEEQEDQLKNLVDDIPQQGITPIKTPRVTQDTVRNQTPDKSQRKPKKKKPKGYDATKGGSYTEYGTEDAMVGISKQLLDYANAIEKLPKKRKPKKKGIGSPDVTRHDSGVPMEAVTPDSAFGHPLRDQNTTKALLNVLKHLPGEHNQESHAGARAGSGKKSSNTYKSSSGNIPRDSIASVEADGPDAIVVIHRKKNKYYTQKRLEFEEKDDFMDWYGKPLNKPTEVSVEESGSSGRMRSSKRSPYTPRQLGKLLR